MKRGELAHNLDAFLGVDDFVDYCPCGLQIEGKEEIRRCATAVSATQATIDRAIEENVDALIVHHGLFWKGDSYCITGAKRGRIERLLKHGISLLAYHLCLDAHQEVGNNFVAARDLGWFELEPFGVGVKGRFHPMPINAFVAELEAYYSHPATVALAGPKTVSSAILISGGAYKELSNAARAGVDCFITGNFDEPAWPLAQEEKIHFCALGHSATEVIGPKALAAHIRKHLGLECDFLEIKNPF